MWNSNLGHEVEEYEIPKILQLSPTGEAEDWITYQDFATLKSKDRILWTTGTYACTLRGGINSITGKRSEFIMDTIVAVKYDKESSKKRRGIEFKPLLNNKMLFERDRYMCAYCGHVYPRYKLTRDHIMPISRGGTDCWTNVCTACVSCNNWKGNKTLEESGLELLYVPYTPSFNEHLILRNRNILNDQMAYLIKGVSEHSPIYKEWAEKLGN